MTFTVTHKATGLAALMAMLCASAAQAAQSAAPAACLTEAEASGVITFILPSMLTSLETRCRDSLPRQSALSTVGLDMAQRMKPDAERAWPTAKAAIGKLSNNAQLPSFLGDSVLKPLLEAAMVAGIVETVKPESCETVDRFVDALSPLPADKLADLITLLIDAGTKSGKPATTGKGTPFAMCPSRLQG